MFVCWALLSIASPANAASSSDNSESAHGSGTLVLHLPEGDVDALALTAHMDLQVQGLLANMSLVQTFRNTSEQWLAGSYLFPLPENAAIRGLRIDVGDRTIRGKIRPRQQAQAIYEKAAQSGQIASLMEQQRPNLFTMKVANIAPQAEIKVTLDVMIPVSIVEQQMQLILPTTLTPRYNNAESHNPHALQSGFSAPEQEVGPTLDVSLQIAPLKKHQSVSSNVTFSQTNEEGLHIDGMRMNQDLIISWPVQHDPSTRIHAYTAEHDDERYVQLLVSPPAKADAARQPARELIVVLDKSGSMAGVSMRAAIEALDVAIDTLQADDLLNIVAFDDQHYPLFEHSMPANESVKRQARQFAKRIQADGGTEMESALAFALQESPDNNNDNEPDDLVEHLRQIVFITDGSIGYEDVLLRQIKAHLGKSRLFTVGIGSAPNRWFLEKAAQAGRGVFISIQDEYRVADAISDLLDNLRTPVLTDIAVSTPNGDVDMFPNPVPDLYMNRPAMWTGKISSEVDEIVITGTQQGKPFKDIVTVPSVDAADLQEYTSSAPSVAMQWARQKISDLEDEQRYSDDSGLHEQTITQLAMQTGLVTRYTSLIAVEERSSRPDSKGMDSRQIANAMPLGNQMMGIDLPQGAAGVDTLLWVSLILGMSGTALLTISRRCF